jgi:hypothetical protein
MLIGVRVNPQLARPRDRLPQQRGQTLRACMGTAFPEAIETAIAKLFAVLHAAQGAVVGQQLPLALIGADQGLGEALHRP